MFKKTLTYKNYNGKQITDDFYFHVSGPEMIELEASMPGGFSSGLQRIIQAESTAALITEFKRFILMAYGIKSEDGEEFIKSEALRAKFVQSAAYEKLYMELALDDVAGAEFITEVFPAELRVQLEAAAAKAQAKNTPANVFETAAQTPQEQRISAFDAMRAAAAATDQAPELPFPHVPPSPPAHTAG